MATLTVREAAQRLGVSEAKVLSWIERGVLPASVAPLALSGTWEDVLASHTRSSGTLQEVLLLDEEDVEEFAEELAWLRASQSAWDDAKIG